MGDVVNAALSVTSRAEGKRFFCTYLEACPDLDEDKILANISFQALRHPGGRRRALQAALVVFRGPTERRISMTLFTSYYTNDIYKRFGARMVDSALALGLNVECLEEKSRGDWYADRQMMPQFLLDRLTAHPWETGICWVDADALFHQRPEILMDEPDFDIAGYYDQQAKEVFWAVLYFRNNDKTKRALEAWALEVRRAPAIPHHGTYSRAMKSVPDMKGFLLPVEYCCIRRHNPGVQPIIENQAISRLTPDAREALLA